MPSPTRPRLAVLASGRGSNLGALLAAIDRGDLPATIVAVVSNNSGSGALTLARDASVDALHISRRTTEDPDHAIAESLREREVDGVLLAGYMRRVGPKLLAQFPGKILNIHPAPLPRFGGAGMFGDHVHQAVLDAGVDTSGPCVHVVTAEYDEGPPLAHTPVPVLPGDRVETLAKRVLAAEHQLYWRAVRSTFCGDGGTAPASDPS